VNTAGIIGGRQRRPSARPPSGMRSVVRGDESRQVVRIVHQELACELEIADALLLLNQLRAPRFQAEPQRRPGTVGRDHSLLSTILMPQVRFVTRTSIL